MYKNRTFIMYFFYVGWWSWSLGVHLDPSSPNFEIHVPFGFFRVGFEKPIKKYTKEELNKMYKKRVIGIKKLKK